MLPDMIEIGSWVGMAAITQSELTIKDVNWNMLGQIPAVFRKLGISYGAKRRRHLIFQLIQMVMPFKII